MSFEERIIDTDGFPCVDLTDAEANLYARSGDAIAYVDGKGHIERFVYIRDIAKPDVEDAVNEALRHGNTWFGWCALPQFCAPRRLDKTSGVRRVLQVIFHA
ncbi:MAG: hypothetical protein HOM25_17575 [Rhodospirillaceae bacterium]|jgi:hypothetical protein|nr:hypothetical protein [Rhodospirillaceae bacterium]MBT5667709.1 hypothetical protein [Rhodospirillaceae bacterium]MBT5812057.1 hypothetical protein [Rhodospirillaceae bacterium]